MTKYIILLGDGMSDEPCNDLAGQTPLQVAKKNALNWFAQNGNVGLVNTVPETLHPGSDVANMGILGYDPKLYYTGRGPIEAAAMSIKVPKDSIIFRCNLVTITNNIMTDFTAGHISNQEGSDLLLELNLHFKQLGIKFYPGVGYRNIVVLPQRYAKLNTTAPHDILDQNIQTELPNGEYEDDMKAFINDCQKILTDSKVNKRRISENKRPATHIWPWSQGPYPGMPSFYEKFNLSGGIVTAVDLLKGLAKLTGLEAPNIKGATGFIDTNYKNKLDAALTILDKHNFCYIHIEAPDECGHMGDAVLKTKAIEDFDQHICEPIKQYCEHNKDTIVFILPDHPTPCRLKTHTREPVPFILFSPKEKATYPAKYYTEKMAKATKLHYESSWDLITRVIKEKTILPD